MSSFQHVRHRAPVRLGQDRALVLVIPQLHSNVNLARILRVAGCCGLGRVVIGGRPKVDPKIARDSLDVLQLEFHRTIAPQLRRLQQAGYPLIGLEQAEGSQNLHAFEFPRRAALVVGHERRGLEPELLEMLDHVVEIPVYGRPLSYNVATATAITLYEYCRQHPDG